MAGKENCICGAATVSDYKRCNTNLLPVNMQSKRHTNKKVLKVCYRLPNFVVRMMDKSKQKYMQEQPQSWNAFLLRNRTMVEWKKADSV